jgi:hypothetical protein
MKDVNSRSHATKALLSAYGYVRAPCALLQDGDLVVGRDAPDAGWLSVFHQGPEWLLTYQHQKPPGLRRIQHRCLNIDSAF